MNVLVIDDEVLVRETVAEGLGDDGHLVVEAASAEDGLALTDQTGPPDVIVTDVNLGSGMSGLALAKEAHSRWPDAGVVIMTGNPASVQDHVFCEQERFLAKPFSNGRLVSAVRELMGRPVHQAIEPAYVIIIAETQRL